MAPAVAAVASRSPKRVSAPAAVDARASARPNGSAGSRPLTIGEVSRRSEFSIKTLRFYERRGLLPPSGRSAGGFRLYTEADLGRLEFIREAKALGLALDQIRELLAATRERSCRMTRPLLLRVLDQRLAQTSEQIETLRRLRQRLQRRRRELVRRPPTDHRLGYCACFGEGQALIPLSALSGKARGLRGS
ncbi:MAG: MerR family transcriptional regulator [Candidatus Rokubacteria bacterium]|nr:MerR family transcriptional regulator [Candidatus Rokubacteria bacterium]